MAAAKKIKILKIIVGGGGINKFAIYRYTLLHIKQIINKDQLYSTGNYIQYLIITERI